MGLINSDENGATEVPGTSNDSLFVFLAGPIRHWWKPGVEGTHIHKHYLHQRRTIHTFLSSDFLVYAPNLAWRGPWNEVAQEINNLAVDKCHALVFLSVEGVPAYGTADEISRAAQNKIPIFEIKVGMGHSVVEQLKVVYTKLIELDKERREQN